VSRKRVPRRTVFAAIRTSGARARGFDLLHLSDIEQVHASVFKRSASLWAGFPSLLLRLLNLQTP
jgi:hypothetical protein